MTCCSKDQKVTTMLLKVDLDCCQCYRKVKKVLCKFPQIRDQTFDEKNNTVKITVVCCSPEKIRDKLCCKAGKSIKSIEILKPQPPSSTKPTTQNPSKRAAEEKPSQMQKNGSKNGSKKSDQPSQTGPPEPQAQWVPCYLPVAPPPQGFPLRMCCTSCSEGRPGGPCYGPGPGYPYVYYERPCPPPPYCASRCDCFTEENPAACSIICLCICKVGTKSKRLMYLYHL